MNRVTHQQTKSHNTQLVFKTICARGKISQADIAHATVSDIVSELIGEVQVYELSVTTVKLLLRLLEKEAEGPLRTILPTELVIRASCGATAMAG